MSFSAAIRSPLASKRLQDRADQPALDTIGLEDDQGPLHGTQSRSRSCGDSRRTVVYSGRGEFATSSESLAGDGLDDPPGEFLVGVGVEPPDADDGRLAEQRDDDPGHRAVVVLVAGRSGWGWPPIGDASGRSPGSPPRDRGARRPRRSGHAGRHRSGSRWPRRSAEGGTTRPAGGPRPGCRSIPAAPRAGSARPSRRGGRGGSPGARSIGDGRSSLDAGSLTRGTGVWRDSVRRGRAGRRP